MQFRFKMELSWKHWWQTTFPQMWVSECMCVSYFTFLSVFEALSSYLHPQTQSHCHCWCKTSGHVLQKARGRDHSLPWAVGLLNQSSAHFCSDQNAAGRPLPSSWGRFHCVQTRHELGVQGGLGGGLCCCCPHLLSQSTGERSTGSGDGLEYQWSAPGEYGVGWHQDWKWVWPGRSLVVQSSGYYCGSWMFLHSDHPLQLSQRTCPQPHNAFLFWTWPGSACETLQNH